MAEEKKKRIRPTWAMVRSLESRLNAAVNEIDNTTAVLKRVRNDLQLTEKSNKLMENELSLLRSKVTLLEEIAANRAAEVFRLQNRGFWSRLFNR